MSDYFTQIDRRHPVKKNSMSKLLNWLQTGMLVKGKGRGIYSEAQICPN
jgi:hypothetical protein